MLQLSGNGRMYGTSLVVLTATEPDDLGQFIQHVGHQSPFGGILVRDYDERSYVEEQQGWYEARGWIITTPPILDEARRLGRIPTSSNALPAEEAL